MLTPASHTDGPAYEPLVSNLSLGSHTILTLTPSPSFYAGVESLSPLTSSSTLALPPPPISSLSTPDPTTAAPSPISIFLPPRSLFLLSSTLYSTFLHTIEPRALDTMDQLKACINWDEYWASEVASAGKEGEDGENKGEGEMEEARNEVDARRRLVEAGKGWERARRVSMTCRRVSKVPTGIKLR